MPALCREFFARYASLANEPSYVDARASTMRLPVFGPATSLLDVQCEIREALLHGGACVAKTADLDFPTSLAQQVAILGPAIPDAVGAGYSTIAVTPNRKYYASSSIGQPMHSDDAHRPTPPPVISLFCDVPSVDGGITTLASLGTYLNELRPSLPRACFSADALTLVGSMGSIQRPLLIDGERLGCALPSIAMEIRGDREVLDVLVDLMNWCHCPANQVRLRLDAGDVLFIDNFRWVHGRTAFPAEQPRRLYRACFAQPG
jgi:hypothetical protein